MSKGRRVKLFKIAGSQAVRIPREFELPGSDAIVRRKGQTLVIEPTTPRLLLDVLERLKPLGEEIGIIDDPAPDSVKI